MALAEQADDVYLTKANGKTLFTSELAQKFDFSEDGQTDGSLNQARVEALQPFKEISANRLAQYDFNAALPNPSDTNNPDFAALFPGAKNFKQ